VVAAVEEERLWIQPFVGVERERDFRAPTATVDKVSVKEVTVRRRGRPVQPEDLEKVEELAVRVAAHRQLVALLNSTFHHRRLVVHQLLYRNHDLKHIFFVNLLAVAEACYHVFYELGCHFVAQPHSIIAVLHNHSIQVQAVSCGAFIWHFNGFEEGISLDGAVA